MRRLDHPTVSNRRAPRPRDHRGVFIALVLAFWLVAAGCSSGEGSARSTIAAPTSSPSSSGRASTSSLVGAAEPVPVSTSLQATSSPVVSSPQPKAVLTLTPGGPYSVGVRDLHWLDDESELRAWYPAEPNTGRGHDSYLPVDRLDDFKASAEDNDRIELAAELDAAPASIVGALPTVLFVPFGNLGALSSGLAQELASHGYLVVLAEPSVSLPDAGDERVGDELARMSRILDHLVAGADSDSIGTADASRLAVGGHSAGGSFAFEMALIDQRVGAVFDLDGALVREASRRAVTVPALVVMTSLGLGGHHDNFPETFSILASTPDVAVVGLNGADHFDVLDAPTVAPVLETISASWPLGPIGATATTSTAELVRRFLDGALSLDRSTPSAASLVADVPGTTDSAEFLNVG